MNNVNIIQKPCLVETSQGFSVSYNNKLLYSKYSPSKAIVQQIQNLTILPGTIVLVYSPVLLYGINELISKIPENCFIFIIELDKELYDFSKSIYSKKDFSEIFKNIDEKANLSFLTIEEALNLPVLLNENNYVFSDGKIFSSAGNFRRVLSIEGSAGIQFYSSLEKQLTEACTNAIMTFWKNRITLTKFGHQYSKSFFKNLKQLSKTTPIENYIKTITKPIIVFGAGESINNTYEYYVQNREKFFILCVDTSYTSLLQNKIIPDGVFLEETQLVILKSLIGTKHLSKKLCKNQENIKTKVFETQVYKTQVFAGLSSINQLSHNIDSKQISYFTTLYTKADFIENLNNLKLLPPTNPPFGSVGLTAVYYALQFRSDETIPVFIYGLDFSYSIGLTHGNGSMAHTNSLLNNNRIKPCQNYTAAFGEASRVVFDKNHYQTISTPVLISYNTLFKGFFCKEKNLYDSAQSGLDLSIPKLNPLQYFSNQSGSEQFNGQISFTGNHWTNQQMSENLNKYFQSEKEALLRLKGILSGEIKMPADQQKEEIIRLAKPREYLYLHFPEGWQFSLEISFLKRIRAEIDCFLKIFNS